jgi:predicted LPLAT superfamily acyltransferase
MAGERQWKGTTGGGDFGQKALFVMLKRIPVILSYPILYLVIPFYFFLERKATNSIKYYHREIWKHGKIKTLWYSFLSELTFGKVVLDKFAVLAGKTEQFDIHFEEQDLQNFQALLDQDKGIIMAGSHIGNFELLGQTLSQDKKPISCIIYGGESSNYQAYRDHSFGKQNIKLIPISNDMSHLFTIKNALDKGEIVAILCDRHFGGRKIKKCEFMGKEAYFPTGIFTMAAQMGLPIVSAFIMKGKGTNYTGYLKQLKINEKEESISKKIEELMKAYIFSIEEILHQYPLQWFNFFPFWEESK